MFLEFLYPLNEYHTIFNVFQYISFRAIYAAITALIISFIFGPYVIKKLQTMQIGEVIREDGPPGHAVKAGTPTMGGLLIIISVVISVLLWGNLHNLYLGIVTFVFLAMGLVGFVDDYKKVVLKDSFGLSARVKFSAQIIISLIAAFVLLENDFNTLVTVPFFKDVEFDLGIFYMVFVVLVITGTSNAVNLTDGLDGLALGPMVISSGTYLLLAYVAGHVKWSEYLQLMYVPGASELAIFAGAMAGAGLGFLWFNTYPAQVFMGDIGALSLGAALGTLAVITKHEILLIIVGGIFVVEALSVIFQVGSYKLRGKRLFKMAPIHHHFELKGWAEPKIIVRFWIIAIILALVAVSTLKLR